MELFKSLENKTKSFNDPFNHFELNEPLTNEPGITKKHKDYDNYNNLIEFFNYKTAIIGIIENNMRSITNETIRNKLLTIYIDFIDTKKKNILENIKKLRDKWDNDNDSFIMDINNEKIKHFRFRCHVYSMTSSVSYQLLEIQFNTYFNKKLKLKT